MVAAVVVAAGAAYAANRAASSASEARDQQGRAQDAQVALGREQLDEGNRRYDQWEEMFMPGFQELRNRAFEEQRPDYETMDADIGLAFDTSQGINRRQMQRYGLNPTDGATAAAETQYGLGRALATVGGRATARRQATNDSYARLAGFANAGNSLYQGSNAMINAAYGGIQSAFGGQAASAGQNAMYQQGQANQGYSDAAAGLGYAWGNYNSRQQTPGTQPSGARYGGT